MSNDAGSLMTDLVSIALARPAQVGLENFAGDPGVKSFCDTLLEHADVAAEIYVSWECPPDVSVLSSGAANAIIRSERLDTVLVEYYRLQEVLRIFGGQLAVDVARAQVYRWMAEFFIGYRNSTLALDALEMRPSLPGLTLQIWNPFRDETLASIAAEPRLNAT